MSEDIDVEIQGSPVPPTAPPPAARIRGPGRFLLLLPGLAFLTLGVLVIFVPELIVAMVATFFFVIGLGLLFAASRVRRVQRRVASFEADFRSRW